MEVSDVMAVFFPSEGVDKTSISCDKLGLFCCFPLTAVVLQKARQAFDHV